MDVALRAIADADDGPSLSRHLERDGTLEQFLEFVVHRSAYQLKEADPHSWALPRLSGGAEGGARRDPGRRVRRRAPRAHPRGAVRRTMDALGLDAAYGAYSTTCPAVTLATVNLMSLFGLHRRLRGALVGHLALFEMTSSMPNRRYGDGLRRLGLGRDATGFFDEHVVADAVHESVAAVDLAGGLAARSPVWPRTSCGARRAARAGGRAGPPTCSARGRRGDAARCAPPLRDPAPAPA